MELPGEPPALPLRGGVRLPATREVDTPIPPLALALVLKLPLALFRGAPLLMWLLEECLERLTVGLPNRGVPGCEAPEMRLWS